MKKPKKPWWKPILDTVLHVIVASAMFVTIALPALGLSLLVKTLEGWGLPAFSTYLLTGLEFVLLTVDVGAVLFYIVKQLQAHLKGSDDDDQDEGHNNGH